MRLPDGILSGRCALVSGGSSGIGNSIARGLYEAGAYVAVASRRDPATWERPMPETWSASECWLPGDFTRLEEMLEGVGRWLESHGRCVDVFVHSAVCYGSAERRPLFGIALDEWDRVFEVGPRAYYAIARLLLPTLIARDAGLMLSVSSEVAVSGGPGRLDYAAAKAASRSISMSLAQELSGTSVSVVDILPEGMVNTPGIRRRRKDPRATVGYASPDSFVPVVVDLARSLGRGANGRCLVVQHDGTTATLAHSGIALLPNTPESP